MPITLGRNLNLCFSKIMRPFSPESPPSSTPTPCNSHLPAATTTATSSVLIKNFNSLYDPTFDHSSSSSLSSATNPFEPDFATAFASQRFFFSSPGRSNSIIESTNTDCTPSSSSSMATTPADPDNKKFFNNSVAVPTYSPDPYLDFRRSMQEMVEARPELMDVNSNWEILHELLLCYLALNPKSTHKYIVGAFADLLVSLMSSPRNADDLAAGGGC